MLTPVLSTWRSAQGSGCCSHLLPPSTRSQLRCGKQKLQQGERSYSYIRVSARRHYSLKDQIQQTIKAMAPFRSSKCNGSWLGWGIPESETWILSIIKVLGAVRATSQGLHLHFFLPKWTLKDSRFLKATLVMHPNQLLKSLFVKSSLMKDLTTYIPILSVLMEGGNYNSSSTYYLSGVLPSILCNRSVYSFI